VDDAEVPAEEAGSGELDRAKEVLSQAYERARAGDYQPGSPSMQALEDAEENYQQVRRGEPPDDVAADDVEPGLPGAAPDDGRQARRKP